MKNISDKIILALPKGKRRFVPGTLKTSWGTIDYIDARSTYHQYMTIIKKEIYDISALVPKPEIIIDCGANIGVSTLYFAKKYPSAEIIALEPQLDAFTTLEKNLSGHQHVKLINKAIWSSETTLRFNSVPSDASSITTAPESSRQVEVKATTLSSYLDRPVDLLKIDIEGAEYEVLKSIEEKMPNIRNIFIECHISDLSGGDLNTILVSLSKNGFRYYLSPESVPGAPFRNMRRPKSGNFFYQINIFASRL